MHYYNILNKNINLFVGQMLQILTVTLGGKPRLNPTSTGSHVRAFEILIRHYTICAAINLNEFLFRAKR